MKRRYDFSSNLQSHGEDKVKPKTNIYQVPFYIGIIVLLYIGLLFGVVWYFEHKLPTPLNVNDEVSTFF